MFGWRRILPALDSLTLKIIAMPPMPSTKWTALKSPALPSASNFLAASETVNAAAVAVEEVVVEGVDDTMVVTVEEAVGKIGVTGEADEIMATEITVVVVVVVVTEMEEMIEVG